MQDFPPAWEGETGVVEGFSSLFFAIVGVILNAINGAIAATRLVLPVPTKIQPRLTSAWSRAL